MELKALPAVEYKLSLFEVSPTLPNQLSINTAEVKETDRLITIHL